MKWFKQYHQKGRTDLYLHKKYKNVEWKLTWDWTRFFRVTARLDWLVVCCELNPLEASLIWIPCDFPEGTKRLSLFIDEEDHDFDPVNSPCIGIFTEYLSLALYNSILCLSTKLISSLIYLTSFCTWKILWSINVIIWCLMKKQKFMRQWYKPQKVRQFSFSLSTGGTQQDFACFSQLLLAPIFFSSQREATAVYRVPLLILHNPV